MSKPRFILTLPLITVLAGCLTTTSSRPAYTSHWNNYVGEQQQWPTSRGSFVHPTSGVDVFRVGELPSRPYQILGAMTGVLDTTAKNIDLNDRIARDAITHGGNVVMFKEVKRSDVFITFTAHVGKYLP